jgi:hypothetical protein
VALSYENVTFHFVQQRSVSVQTTHHDTPLLVGSDQFGALGHKHLEGFVESLFRFVRVHFMEGDAKLEQGVDGSLADVVLGVVYQLEDLLETLFYVG